MKKCNISSTCLLIILLLGLILAPATLLAQATRGAGVPVEALPEELKGLDIKDYYVPSTQKKAGIIHALRGNVVVIHKATRRLGQVFLATQGIDPLGSSNPRQSAVSENRPAIPPCRRCRCEQQRFVNRSSLRI